MAKKSRSAYVCQSCGHNAARWFGRCAACGEWNTCVEERPQEVDKRREHIAVPAPRSELQPITEVDDQDHERLQGGIGEDWIFGGPGNDVLTGGLDRNASDIILGGPGDDSLQILTDQLPLLGNQPGTVFEPAIGTYIPTANDQLDGGDGDDALLTDPHMPCPRGGDVGVPGDERKFGCHKAN